MYSATHRIETVPMKKRMTTADAEFQARTGTVYGVEIVPLPGEGWGVVFLVGMQRIPVASTRSDVRSWRSIDTIAKWLQQIGLGEARLKLTT